MSILIKYIRSRYPAFAGHGCVYTDMLSVFDQLDKHGERLTGSLHHLNNRTHTYRAVEAGDYVLNCRMTGFSKINAEPNQARQIDIKTTNPNNH